MGHRSKVIRYVVSIHIIESQYNYVKGTGLNPLKLKLPFELNFHSHLNLLTFVVQTSLIFSMIKTQEVQVMNIAEHNPELKIAQLNHMELRSKN